MKFGEVEIFWGEGKIYAKKGEGDTQTKNYS